MKAAVVTALSVPLKIRDLPTPVPGPGQVLVRMWTRGLGHTDIHATEVLSGDASARLIFEFGAGPR